MQIDPWEKVAECEYILRRTIDPRQRELSCYLHGIWLSLAHRGRFLSHDQLAIEIEAASQLQKDFQADLDRSVILSTH